MEKGQIELEQVGKGNSVIGVDEVGRGCIAGPVFGACVALDYSKLKGLDSKTLGLIRDSKKLSALQRKKIQPIIQGISKECHIGRSSVREIEKYGIVEATFLAIRRALDQCDKSYDLLLMDGKQKVSGYTGNQMAIVGGDGLCFAIAAASILAKEARDAYMKRKSSEFPEYDFDKNVGYGTKTHLSAIHDYGICSLHRKNFSPISSMISDATV